MTNGQILKKAIEKAVRNGWDATKEWSVNAFIDEEGVFRCSELEIEDTFNIIFSHDFAKAFWGKNDLEFDGARMITLLTNGEYTTPRRRGKGFYLTTYKIIYEKGVKAWVYHLQRMVLEKNPIKYLKQFLK